MPFETETESSSQSTDTVTTYEMTTNSGETSSTSGSTKSSGEVWIGLTEAEAATKEKSTTTATKSYNLQHPPSNDETMSYGSCVLQDKGYQSFTNVDKKSEMKNEDSPISSLEFSPPSAKYKIYEDDQRKNVENYFRADENDRQTIRQRRASYVQQNPIPMYQRQNPNFAYQQQNPNFVYQQQNPNFVYPQAYPAPMFLCPTYPFSTMLSPPHPPMQYYPIMPTASYDGGYPVPFTFGHPFMQGPPTTQGHFQQEF